MLKKTFCHIPGIGPRLESRLWSRGFRSWHDVLEKPTSGLPPFFRSSFRSHLRRSIGELEAENAPYFAALLPPTETWRLFGEFRHRTAYVDIETTGLRPEFSQITTIALFDGVRIRCYVCDRNLEDFVADVSEYRVLVTYNGRCFDIPFIERYFGIKIEAAQIDLRYVLRSLGYKGGLKGCEKQLGIGRGDLDGVDGYFAVLLWHDYVENGNQHALETLLAYNVEDVVNLERLVVAAHNLKIKNTPFALSDAFDPPESPGLPFKPDRETIRRIRETYLWR